jgi:hypothetical protein
MILGRTPSSNAPEFVRYCSGMFARQVIAAAALLASALGASAQMPQTQSPMAGGIWKAVVPPTAMKGEFDNFDPVGIAAGARIKADCSINWVDPDDGARYCFSSGTSLEFFLDDPNGNIKRAREQWHKLSQQR